MEKLSINNLSKLIWVLEFPEGDETFTGAIKDVQGLVEIEGFRHIYDTERTVKEAIDESINLFNEMIELGVIKFPEHIEERLEHPTPTPVDQPNDTAVSKGINVSTSLNEQFFESIKDESLDTDNSIKRTDTKQVETIVPDKLRNYQPPLNNIAENPATSRLTYKLDDSDRKVIADLELPKKKQYILQEIRGKFGKPIDQELLRMYGKNRFARGLERIYPNAYKISEIKSVITRITDYEKAVKNLRPVS